MNPETELQEKKRKEYSGLDVSGILLDFDTLEEAEKHYKNFPQGSYTISKNKDYIGE